MLKKILISLGVIIVVAGIAFGVLYFVKGSQQTATNDPATPKSILDHSKDYGACDLLDTSSIKTALGDTATTLQGPENMGIVGDKLAGSGVDDVVSDSQICVYAFGPGGTLANGFNSSDAFIIQKTVYTNESGPKTLIEQNQEQMKIDPSVTAVEKLGDAAFYTVNTVAKGPGATYSFKIQVFTGKTSVEYSIRQPAELATFTAETALTALTQLANDSKQD